MALAPKGRRTNNRKWIKGKTTYRDTIPPDSATMGMLIRQDSILEVLKATLTKLDADTGVADTDYATLAAQVDELLLM